MKDSRREKGKMSKKGRQMACWKGTETASQTGELTEPSWGSTTARKTVLWMAAEKESWLVLMMVCRSESSLAMKMGPQMAYSKATETASQMAEMTDPG